MTGDPHAYYYTYPVAVALGCAVALGLVLFALALVRALVTGPDLIEPAADRAERVSARPVGPGEFDPDPAWPFYPFRQSRSDLRRARKDVVAGNAAVWERPARWFFRDAKGWWVLFPVPAVIVAFLSVASLVSWLCYLIYALVTSVCATGSRALLIPAAALLNAIERARRARLRTQAACTRCYHVTPWPAYQCPACLRKHHDVRPGRLGLVVRRCECGTHLPTRASRAARRVTALCARCGAVLPSGAGAVRDIRVPVFGDTSAGKTRFIYASLNSLLATARRVGLEVSYPDDDSTEQAEFGLSVIRSGAETAKTSTNTQVALTIRLGKGRRSELVHLFDAAGERFHRARQPGPLSFLDDGQGLVYILDPFSIEDVRKQLGGVNSLRIRQARAAAGDPELTYHEVASRLRDGQVPASGGRLAVVVSKVDLLREAGLAVPEESAAIEEWLRGHGVHNLVLATRRDFTDVRFYAVSSQAAPPGAPYDPGSPLRWLLRAHGVRRVPAEGTRPAPSVSDARPGPRGHAPGDRRGFGDQYAGETPDKRAGAHGSGAPG